MNYIKLHTNGLKPDTIKKLKELYRDFPELIEYLIKFGNVYEKAQATLIKSVAVSDLQVPDCLPASECLQNTCGQPPSSKIKSDVL